ncbi:hypothetical protein MBLNU459_g7588t2 [Dothideomycetes sp. NU459]
MARSASDATRFTATGPYAAAKPSSNIAMPGRGAPAGETAQQKIARLRAATAAARAGKESGFDKVVRVGRRWADRAHRATAWSLIGLTEAMATVTSGVIASFAIGDMLMHNRRKRSEWLAEQQAKHRAQLDEARAVLASGGALDEDQRLLLNQERAQMEAAELQKNKKGIFTRARESLFASVPGEETKGGALLGGGGAAQNDGSGVLAAVEEKVRKGAKTAQEQLRIAEQKAQQGYEVVEDKAQQAYKAAEQKAQEGYRAAESTAVDVERRAGLLVGGGPLDREAQASADALRRTGKSWTSWLTGR